MLFDVAALKWPSSILVAGFALLKCKLQQRWIAPLLVAATSFAANLQSCSKLLTANLLPLLSNSLLSNVQSISSFDSNFSVNCWQNKCG
ncbi:hypothetical protein U1Q18_013859 [Sarracenia purpurea var. burkii]